MIVSHIALRYIFMGGQCNMWSCGLMKSTIIYARYQCSAGPFLSGDCTLIRELTRKSRTIAERHSGSPHSCWVGIGGEGRQPKLSRALTMVSPSALFLGTLIKKLIDVLCLGVAQRTVYSPRLNVMCWDARTRPSG